MPPKPHEYRYIENFGNGKIPMCGCKRSKCKQCDYLFPKEENELDNCPQCGLERYCTNARIKDPTSPNKWLPCGRHGGLSHKVRGAASPHFKGGKYSKHLPARLLETYESAREDPDILSLNDDIALTLTRIEDVIKRVDANESGFLWDELTKAAKDFKAAQRANDTEMCQSLLESILDLIQKGKNDWGAWREIGDLMERKRKLSESQLKLLTTKQEFISRQQAVSFATNIVQIVRENISDPEERRKVAIGIQTLMNLPENQTPHQNSVLRNVMSG